ncbi:hypothetical protein ACV349_02435 [Pseudomonas aeruginosa]|uniref:hypothetical protein n=1 Tax=Pseudomonas TaxID=286 RepID=UPI0003B94C82|nr:MULTISPECIES: hypothetical protein [Pseudomonas]SAJ33012.1 Uncharacterised protein [Enterobacter cloacae]DAL14730.1 MAG TPA_asm: hypothetical protein [Caudoviricetes sp.]ASM87249.1 hypothetical protein BWR11_23485 [Pseudomonas aeruginosa]AXS73370.1 hypothetical protein CTT40_04811 [Pseudomonas aeruginosa]EIU3128404.1 hypothetical protein [Pseudomonas aeruginosa]
MKGATMHRLIDLGVDSSRNLRVRIAALRMFIRAVHADRDASFAEHRQKWRRLLKGMPFTEQALERERMAYRERARVAAQAMEECGAWLIGNSAMIEQALSFDDLCDLLGVNHAHRAEAAEVCAGDAGIVGGLLWIGGEFEDSADHKSGRSNRGNTGPLTAAVHNLFQKFLLENPSAIPDPFAPDGPFYGAPRQETASDGTVQIRRPALTVHSQDGSIRTVERKPEAYSVVAKDGGGRHG